MKILIDARTLKEKPSGVGNVVLSIVKRLSKKNLEIILVVSKNMENLKSLESLADLRVVSTGMNYQFIGFKRLFTEQFIMKRIIRKYKPDIIHFTDSFGVALSIDRRIKVVLTLHDLIPLTQFREFMGPIDFFIYKRSLEYSIARADKIVCISEYTKKDLVKKFPNLSNDKIQIVKNGVDFKEEYRTADFSSISNAYGIEGKFILYMGGFGVRKNLISLIKAFNAFKYKNEYQLIIPGKISDKKEIKKNHSLITGLIKDLGLGKKIILPGYVSDREKFILMKNARIFAYISLYEGFGLPVLEALSMNALVVTSKDSAMLDVAQDNAIYADPLDINDIKKKLEYAEENYDVLKEKVNKNRESLLKLYDWDEAADTYYKLYLALGD